MPVSMTPTRTPLPVCALACQTSGAPMSGTDELLVGSLGVRRWIALTPGIAASAVTRFASVRTAMPEYAAWALYRVRARVAAAPKRDSTRAWAALTADVWLRAALLAAA